MTFGERLEKCIRESNYTQKDLAEKIGVTPVRLNYWVKDKRQPDVPFIRLLAMALNVSADYLIGNDCAASEPALSPEAQELARVYDSLDPDSKRVVMAVAKLESERTPASLPKGIMPMSAMPMHNVPYIGAAKCDGTVETRHAARQELQELADDSSLPQLDPIPQNEIL